MSKTRYYKRSKSSHFHMITQFGYFGYTTNKCITNDIVLIGLLQPVTQNISYSYADENTNILSEPT